MIVPRKCPSAIEQRTDNHGQWFHFSPVILCCRPCFPDYLPFFFLEWLHHIIQACLVAKLYVGSVLYFTVAEQQCCQAIIRKANILWRKARKCCTWIMQIVINMSDRGIVISVKQSCDRICSMLKQFERQPNQCHCWYLIWVGSTDGTAICSVKCYFANLRDYYLFWWL